MGWVRLAFVVEVQLRYGKLQPPHQYFNTLSRPPENLWESADQYGICRVYLESLCHLKLEVRFLCL